MKASDHGQNSETKQSTKQSNTTQHSTTQHNTTQHNTTKQTEQNNTTHKQQRTIELSHNGSEHGQSPPHYYARGNTTASPGLTAGLRVAGVETIQKRKEKKEEQGTRSVST